MSKKKKPGVTPDISLDKVLKEANKEWEKKSAFFIQKMQEAEKAAMKFSDSARGMFAGTAEYKEKYMKQVESKYRRMKNEGEHITKRSVINKVANMQVYVPYEITRAKNFIEGLKNFSPGDFEKWKKFYRKQKINWEKFQYFSVAPKVVEMSYQQGNKIFHIRHEYSPDFEKGGKYWSTWVTDAN